MKYIFVSDINHILKNNQTVNLSIIFKENINEKNFMCTDFWERILLNGHNFRGNPTQKHINVDNNMNNTINQEHFGRWLMLWFQTIDELYDCERANTVKEASRKIAHAQFMMIYNHRNK